MHPFILAADYHTWKRILEKSESKEGLRYRMGKLGEMYRYLQRASQCRHRAILGYFGQNLDTGNCRACDICLGEIEPVADPLVRRAEDTILASSARASASAPNTPPAC